jgi:hypothetical protein
VTILLAWFLADLVTGLVHWVEDRLLIFNTGIKFLEGIKADNDLHHAEPTALTKYSYWGNINTSAIFAWPLSVGLYFLGVYPVICLAVFFTGFANLIHRFAHTPEAELPRIVLLLQKTGLFLSSKHHHTHHYGPHGLIRKEETTGCYCAMTNWVNPIVDKIGLFTFLNKLIQRLF